MENPARTFDDGKDEFSVALTGEQIKAQCESWSLASDLGLLGSLKTFAGNFFEQSDNVCKDINKLVYESNDKSTKVRNVINDFQMLANSQFIESRVYDEEPEDVVIEAEESCQAVQAEADILPKIKQSLVEGLSFLHRRLPVISSKPESTSADSDEEDNIQDEVLAAIRTNKFTNRALPFVIGTYEFEKEALPSVQIDDEPDVAADAASSQGEYDSDPDEPAFRDVTPVFPITSPLGNNILDDPDDDGDIFQPLANPIPRKPTNLEFGYSQQPAVRQVITPPVEVSPNIEGVTLDDNSALVSDHREPRKERTGPVAILEDDDSSDDGGIFSTRGRKDIIGTSKKSSIAVITKKGTLFSDSEEEDDFPIHPKPSASSNKPMPIPEPSKTQDVSATGQVSSPLDGGTKSFKDALNERLAQPRPPMKQQSPANEKVITSNYVAKSQKSDVVANGSSDKLPVRGLLSDDSSDEGDLFAKATPSRKVEPVSVNASAAPPQKVVVSKVTKPVPNLFSDSDSDDGIFGFPRKSIPAETSVQATIVQAQGAIPKERSQISQPSAVSKQVIKMPTHFDDESSDEDSSSIFAPRSNAVKVGISKPDRTLVPKRNLFSDSDDEDDPKILADKRVSSEKPSADLQQNQEPQNKTLNFEAKSSSDDDFGSPTKTNFRSALNNILARPPQSVRQKTPNVAPQFDSDDDDLFVTKAPQKNINVSNIAEVTPKPSLLNDKLQSDGNDLFHSVNTKANTEPVTAIGAVVDEPVTTHQAVQDEKPIAHSSQPQSVTTEALTSLTDAEPFENSSGTISILSNDNLKARARVSKSRRPPTRKPAKNTPLFSATNDELDSSNDIDVAKNEPIPSTTLKPVDLTETVEISTSSVDINAVAVSSTEPETSVELPKSQIVSNHDTFSEFKVPTLVKKQTVASSLFADDDSDEDVFSVASRLKTNKQVVAKPKSALFDDDDDDDFAKPSVTTVQQPSATKPSSTKNNLFDDDDEDDLFSPSASKVRGESSSATSRPAAAKSATTYDPLSQQ